MAGDGTLREALHSQARKENPSARRRLSGRRHCWTTSASTNWLMTWMLAISASLWRGKIGGGKRNASVSRKEPSGVWHADRNSGAWTKRSLANQGLLRLKIWSGVLLVANWPVSDLTPSQPSSHLQDSGSLQGQTQWLSQTKPPLRRARYRSSRWTLSTGRILFLATIQFPHYTNRSPRTRCLKKSIRIPRHP